MANPNQDALKQQINSDPRVRALAESRRSGEHAGFVTPWELREQFGYDAPSDWGYLGTGGQSRGWRNAPDGPGVVDQFSKWTYLIAGGAAALGGYAAMSGALAPAAASAAQGPELASRTINGLHEAVPDTSGMGSQSVSGAPQFGNGGGNGSGVGDRVRDGLMDAVTDPRKLASLMALYPALRQFTSGGGQSAEELGLLDEARQGMALQRGRIEQAQPIYDMLIRRAYANAPIRDRGPAPEGYQAPTGGYNYQSPRFGGR